MAVTTFNLTLGPFQSCRLGSFETPCPYQRMVGSKGNKVVSSSDCRMIGTAPEQPLGNPAGTRVSA